VESGGVNKPLLGRSEKGEGEEEGQSRRGCRGGLRCCSLMVWRNRLNISEK
jgi:hypothetical protein